MAGSNIYGVDVANDVEVDIWKVDANSVPVHPRYRQYYIE